MSNPTERYTLVDPNDLYRELGIYNDLKKAKEEAKKESLDYPKAIIHTDPYGERRVIIVYVNGLKYTLAPIQD